MRDRYDTDDLVQKAYNEALLSIILPPMRKVARDAGYTLALHGSISRDIDCLAVAWAEHNVWTKEALRDSLVGAIRGAVGRCHISDRGAWETKPHGRFASILLVWCGENTASIDLSVIPPREKDQSDDT